MSLVVCRVAKLHSMSKIGKAGAHNFRLESEANREHLKQGVENILLHGSKDLVADVKARLNDATKNANGEFRTNAVLAVEMFLSASPEYFINEEATNLWAEKNITWLKERYGKNFVSAVMHLDEQTPQIHAFIVPIDDTNKLNCRAFFGGPDKMRELQDQSFLAVKDLGIKRGIPKEITGATHKTTKQWRKEQLEIDKDNKSLTKAIDNIKPIQSKIAGFDTGITKTDNADLYYKEQAKKEIKKALPTKIKSLSNENKELKTVARNALNEKNKAELNEKEAKNKLLKETEFFNNKVKEIEQLSFENLVKIVNQECYQEQIENILLNSGQKKLDLFNNFEKEVKKDLNKANITTSTEDFQKAIMKSREKHYNQNDKSKNRLIR